MAHPIEVKFEIWTRVGPRNYAFGRCLDPPRKVATLGDVSQAVVNYKGYLACVRYSQCYSLGGSSNAAVCFEFCSSLFWCAAGVVQWTASSSLGRLVVSTGTRSRWRHWSAGGGGIGSTSGRGWYRCGQQTCHSADCCRGGHRRSHSARHLHQVSHYFDQSVTYTEHNQVHTAAFIHCWHSVYTFQLFIFIIHQTGYVVSFSVWMSVCPVNRSLLKRLRPQFLTKFCILLGNILLSMPVVSQTYRK